MDSLSRRIDSLAHAYNAQQDSAIKQRDSFYKSEVNRSLEQNSRNLDNFLAEQERREHKEGQQAIIRILFGVLILIIAIIVLVRRRKTRY